MNREELIEHWNIFGKHEFHRIHNPSLISKFANKNYFIAGTCFVINKPYLELLKIFNLNYEYSILETGYIVNDVPRKTHAWEYMFGYLAYLYGGVVLGLLNNKLIKNENLNRFNLNIYKNCNNDLKHFTKKELINHYENFGKYEKRISSKADLLKKQSIINNRDSDIAIFMIITSDNLSGGYRTLLKYIHFLNSIDISIDIYFGFNFTSTKTYNGLNIIHMSLNEILEIVDSYKEIDINKNNYYLGFNCIKRYNILIANAWQTAEAVYYNKKYAKKLCYIIQDVEHLFFKENLEMQKYIKNSYKPEYNYYCLSKYLTNTFKQYSKKVFSSFICVDTNMYTNIKNKREKSIILAYYTNKMGRIPELIYEIVNILSSNNIKCYVFPDKIDIVNDNIINLGSLSPTDLNRYYNIAKVGCVFSNTNPSRLGFEMLASGLNVIEYDSEFTKYDLPNKFFTKITTSNNIVNIVKSLFLKEQNNSEEFINKIALANEKNNFIKYIKGLLQ
jgi:hypothetical protein